MTITSLQDMLRGPADAGHLSMRDNIKFPHPEVRASRTSKGLRMMTRSLLLIAILSLAACGIKGDLEPPPDAEKKTDQTQ